MVIPLFVAVDGDLVKGMVKPSGESNGMGYKPHVVAEPYGGCLSRPPPPSSSFIGKHAKYEKNCKISRPIDLVLSDSP